VAPLGDEKRGRYWIYGVVLLTVDEVAAGVAEIEARGMDGRDSYVEMDDGRRSAAF
jgi:hypothetical protein